MANKDQWSGILVKLAGQLSEEETTILTALASGKTMPEVGKMLGQHRSMIWRKTQRIKARVEIMH